MKVLKFGGTSVGTAENLLNVKRIIETNDDSVIVVVSALGGLTDKLIETSRLAEAGDVAFEKRMTEIIDRHLSIIAQVISSRDRRDILLGRVNVLLTELHQHYQDVFAVRELSDKKLSTIVSYGERLSSIIVASLIEGACWFDSLSFIKTEYKHHKHTLSGEITDQLIHKYFQSLPKVALVPGFISTDINTGEITNLGRGGSDYTAAIMAAALDAECLEIWTDVDGFMTADPRLIASAFPIKELSYNEAEELCNYGAKVVYPPTIYPVWYKDIPVLIKNTMNPEAAGTYIRHAAQAGRLTEKGKRADRLDNFIKGISSVKDTCLISITDIWGENLTEVWRDLAQALSEECIQILVSYLQPSDGTIQVGFKKEDVEFACMAMKNVLSSVTDGRFRLDIIPDLSTIALVGNLSTATSVVAQNLFDHLHQRGISVLTPCLEHSELTFAYMVPRTDLNEALEITHVTAFQNNPYWG